MNKILDSKNLQFIIFIYALFLFVPLLGRVHLFDWDEINFAESAREMLLTKDFFHVQINFEQFWEKPPLFIWLQALSMQLFGINEMAARLPNAIAGAFTLVVLFRIGKKHYSTIYGFIWAFVYSGTFLTHLYFKSGIIDPIFNLFIFLGIYHLALLSKSKVETAALIRKHALFAGLFIGLAILTKGPVALLVVLLSAIAFSIYKKQLVPFTFPVIGWFTLAILPVTFLWYGVELIQNGPWFLVTFIEYQIRLFTTEDAGHGGPFFYHFVVLLVGCFPASILVFKSFAKNTDDNVEQSSIKTWMIILLLVVLILFSIVNTKIVHYSSLCYFPLTFLATDYLNKLYLHKKTFPFYLTMLMLFLGTLIGLVIMLFPLLMINKAAITPLFKDDFAVANLDADVKWSGIETLIGFAYLVVLWGAFLIKSKKTAFRSIVIVFINTIVVIQLTLYIIVPKVEAYSQRAAIEYFESIQNTDCYVEVLDYKSYAHLFYAKKPMNQRAESKNLDWLLEGDIDKPVYFITKIDRGERFRTMPQLKNIGSKNGFVFYLRTPKPTLLKF